MHILLLDEEYSKLLACEGSRTPSDIDANFEMKLPEWADHAVIKRYIIHRPWNLFKLDLKLGIRFLFSVKHFL